MVHSGFEASAVADTVKHPLKALGVLINGVRTDGPMAPDIPIDKQRPAEYVFTQHVEEKLADIRASNPRAKKVARALS
jgi:hypothetical protein